MTGFFLNMTGFVLNMTGFVLNNSGFVLNFTGFVQNVTVFVLYVTVFVLISVIFCCFFLPVFLLLSGSACLADPGDARGCSTDRKGQKHWLRHSLH